MSPPDPRAADAALVAGALPGWTCAPGRDGAVFLAPPGEGHQTLPPEGPAFRALAAVAAALAACRAEVGRLTAATAAPPGDPA